MSYASLDELRSQLGSHKARSSIEYAEKMLHRVPDAPVVDRAKFILKRCEGKRVLEFGASGELHKAVKTTALSYWGVDREDADQVIGYDLDDVARGKLPAFNYDPEIIVCGEVLEHLTNPGHFLRRLKAEHDGVPVIITTPNAFGLATNTRIREGVENVNADHVAWYSYHTLKTLLEKCGYSILDWAWYKGQPYTAEGLVMVCV